MYADGSSGDKKLFATDTPCRARMTLDQGIMIDCLL